MATEIVTRREGAVRWIGLDRPAKRNALTRDLLAALVDAVAAAEREPETRAVIVYGEGPVFSAGVDFGMLAGDVQGEERVPFRSRVGEMQAAITRLLKDDALHRDLAAKARARAPQFTEDRWLDGVVAMYRRAAGGRKFSIFQIS